MMADGRYATCAPVVTVRNRVSWPYRKFSGGRPVAFLYSLALQAAADWYGCGSVHQQHHIVGAFGAAHRWQTLCRKRARRSLPGLRRIFSMSIDKAMCDAEKMMPLIMEHERSALGLPGEKVCSFCGVDGTKVRLIQGRGASICPTCVTKTADAFAKWEEST